MNETPITMAGNLVEDPELRYTPGGSPVTSFRLASTQRFKRDGSWVDGDTLFLTVTCWRDLAEHVAECLNRGDRVVVTGRLKQRQYETRDGDKRTTVEVEAHDVGASLQRSTVKIAKTVRSANPEGDEAPV